MKELDDYLASIEAGPVLDSSRCAQVLSKFWSQFDGSSAESTSPNKLTSRALEGAKWEPPILSFAIERHGATVNGSSRASVHRWEVNVTKRTARIVERKNRQLEPLSPRVNVKPIAEGVAALIVNGIEDPLLKWHSPTDVSVQIGKIEDLCGAAQTQLGRRKRFRKSMESILAPRGWKPVPRRFNRYVRTQMAEIDVDSTNR